MGAGTPTPTERETIDQEQLEGVAFESLPLFERCLIGRLDCIHLAILRFAQATQQLADQNTPTSGKVARAAAAAASNAVERVLDRRLAEMQTDPTETDAHQAAVMARLVDWGLLKAPEKAELFDTAVKILEGDAERPSNGAGLEGGQPDQPTPETPAEAHQPPARALPGPPGPVPHHINDAGVAIFKCAHPRCPGYSYAASQRSHPTNTCGPDVPAKAPKADAKAPRLPGLEADKWTPGPDWVRTETFATMAGVHPTAVTAWARKFPQLRRTAQRRGKLWFFHIHNSTGEVHKLRQAGKIRGRRK